MGVRRNKRESDFYMEKKKKKVAFRDTIFIHTSQEPDRSVRRLNFLMRLVISLVVVGILIVLTVFIFRYLVPFLQKEIADTLGVEKETSSMSSYYIEPVPSFDENGLPIYQDQDILVVINSKNPAEADNVPEIKEVAEIPVNVKMEPALEALLTAAESEGISLEIETGYVSYKEQGLLYEEKVRQLVEEEGKSNVMARTQSKETTPVAGESDFQTGFCVLLKADPKDFLESQASLWLNRNMVEYGFIFRYPENKETETGLLGNPCVLRYVGTDNAKRMRQLSMCLEEYLNYLGAQGEY